MAWTCPLTRQCAQVLHQGDGGQAPVRTALRLGQCPCLGYFMPCASVSGHRTERQRVDARAVKRMSRGHRYGPRALPNYGSCFAPRNGILPDTASASAPPSPVKITIPSPLLYPRFHSWCAGSLTIWIGLQNNRTGSGCPACVAFILVGFVDGSVPTIEPHLIRAISRLHCDVRFWCCEFLRAGDDDSVGWCCDPKRQNPWCSRGWHRHRKSVGIDADIAGLNVDFNIVVDHRIYPDRGKGRVPFRHALSRADPATDGAHRILTSAP